MLNEVKHPWILREAQNRSPKGKFGEANDTKYSTFLILLMGINLFPSKSFELPGFSKIKLDILNPNLQGGLSSKYVFGYGVADIKGLAFVN